VHLGQLPAGYERNFDQDVTPGKIRPRRQWGE
jgi:hypothetical protein